MSARSPRNASGMTPDARKEAQDSCGIIGNLLQLYQKKCLTAKTKVTNMKQREVSPIEKNDLDSQILEIKGVEEKIKEKIASQTKQLASYPPGTPANPVPSDVVQFRTVLSKLTKDYEKMRQLSVEISTDARFIKVNAKELEEYNAYLALNPPNNSNNSSNGINGTDEYSSHPNGTKPASHSMNSVNQLQRLQEKEFIITACEDVDMTIINERHEDFEKIHQGSIMLNEMFVDLSQIVESQAPAIEEIASNIGKTHDSAKSGLNQIEQAEKLQKQGNKVKDTANQQLKQFLEDKINKAQVGNAGNSEQDQDEYRLEMDRLRNEAERQSKKRKINTESGKFAGLNPSVALLMMDNSDAEDSSSDSDSSDSDDSNSNDDSSGDHDRERSKKKDHKKKRSKSSRDKSEKKDKRKKEKKEKREKKEKKEKKRKDKKRG